MKDRQLFELAQEEAELKEKIKKLKKRQDSVKERIVKELQRRDVKSLTKIVGGVQRKLTLVSPTETRYDPDGFLHDLGAKKFQTITTRVIDKAKLLNAVQTNKIPADVLDRNSIVFEKASYPVYTEGSVD